MFDTNWLWDSKLMRMDSHSTFHCRRLFAASRHFLHWDSVSNTPPYPKWRFMGSVRGTSPALMVAAILRRPIEDLPSDRGVTRVALSLVFLLETGFDNGPLGHTSAIMERKGSTFYRMFCRQDGNAQRFGAAGEDAALAIARLLLSLIHI